MNAESHRGDDEELHRRGEAIYRDHVRPRLPAEEGIRIVAVDVETGAYAIADNVLAAVHPIQDGRPRAAIFTRRVGGAQD